LEAGAYRYQRHQPENNLLYRIVERHYPEITAYLAELGVTLEACVQYRYRNLPCLWLQHESHRLHRGTVNLT